MILHITSRQAWEDAKRRGVYEAPSLASEGFIHCSSVAQTLESANRFYSRQVGLVLLVIDEQLVKPEVRYEAPADAREDAATGFPHIYGPLNADAVVSEHDFEPSSDGSFALPAILDVS